MATQERQAQDIGDTGKVRGSNESKPWNVRRLALTLPMFLAVVAAIGGHQSRERIDVTKLGPRVGERVPDFSLPDQAGVTRTLPSIMGPRGAMVVFIRSADW